MAEARLTSTDRLPIGTQVKAFPRSAFPAWQPMPSGKPEDGLKAAATQTMGADGSLTFTRLEPGPYVAYAEVDGQHRYVAFQVKE